jgi:hypothetical protein
MRDRHAIVERHPAQERTILHVDRQERGIAQSKAPFARIRDEQGALGPRSLCQLPRASCLTSKSA